MMKTITLVTGNKKKLEEVISILGDTFPHKLIDRKLDLYELQGEPDYVSESKCKAAADVVKGPVVVEDTCLCYNAMHGLPGPYIKWFLEKLGPEGLYKLLDGWQDKTAKAMCTLAFTEGPGSEVKLFKGIVDGSIVYPRGPRDFGWDPVFQPEGYDKTFAELGVIKHKISHRSLAVQAFRDYFRDDCSLLK
ncbi:inosine triphosphate pyrophosphatase-like protein [Leptotrombidium deliense]|uniref:Inosine triphosphate pyrophosphatase n=1 Tax=Leptotrombidium deliense TaxID=299467 RepID=A0A443SSD8_9ACAR|nr:inosine triphosphate pyrophosphatase-like protein [Leptotrombidium deliense]